MKFRIYNNQIIRNEMAYVGGHYPLFSMGDNIDGYVEYPSGEVIIAELEKQIELADNDEYIYETWKWVAMLCGGTARMIQPIGYDAIPAELVYAERYNEI